MQSWDLRVFALELDVTRTIKLKAVILGCSQLEYIHVLDCC